MIQGIARKANLDSRQPRASIFDKDSLPFENYVPFQNPLKIKRKKSKNIIDPYHSSNNQEDDQNQRQLFRINSFVEEPKQESPVNIKMRRALQRKILTEIEDESNNIKNELRLIIAGQNLIERDNQQRRENEQFNEYFVELIKHIYKLKFNLNYQMDSSKIYKQMSFTIPTQEYKVFQENMKKREGPNKFQKAVSTLSKNSKLTSLLSNIVMKKQSLQSFSRKQSQHLPKISNYNAFRESYLRAKQRGVTKHNHHR
ncbi:UNKNOWN [Stylonychia lemnae]|uniref:Uncharacterized protein n=1 Tax=Stylonychia lemnae TaxID=5949 RepID=A0A078B4E9_STYLE|nr:UNKNOWN [Stylonychia lemnae]|eukprot:CDW89359.1 UNKNOWN [Stylonychia lemnae]